MWPGPVSQTTIDILKIDIECSEWSSFDAILASPRCLDNVKQLMVEFHPCRFRRESKSPHELLGYWRTLRRIDELGFKLWKVWNNNTCRFRSRRFKKLEYIGCFNAYYLNIKYLLWDMAWRGAMPRREGRSSNSTCSIKLWIFVVECGFVLDFVLQLVAVQQIRNKSNKWSSVLNRQAWCSG